MTSLNRFGHKTNHKNLFRLPGDNNAPVNALVKTPITHASHNSKKSNGLYSINTGEAPLISADLSQSQPVNERWQVETINKVKNHDCTSRKPPFHQIFKTLIQNQLGRKQHKEWETASSTLSSRVSPLIQSLSPSEETWW